MSVDEAPLDVIQVIKQSWSEEPEKRPTFEEIFKQVKTLKAHTYVVLYSSNEPEVTFLFPPFDVTVQEHHQGKEDQHHRLYAAHVGTVLLQLGGSD